MAHFSTNQLMDILLLNKKWHEGLYDSAGARLIKHRHKKGILTIEVYERIFYHHGYKKELSWSI